MIYVSTGGFKDLSAKDACELLFNNAIVNIELSGGKFSPNILDEIQNLRSKLKFQVHNYFPPPENPFVINLASLDKEIGERSFHHIQKSILFSKAVGATRYSFHAGFLIDPNVSQLGKKITSKQLFNRDEATEVFLNRVNKLALIAEANNISLMIENNVLSKKNLLEFQANPLLMCDATECKYIMSKVSNNIKLLLDVAHLKVSANSLNFILDDFFRDCDDYISGYHLSDNDGLSDSNDEFDEESWFWPYIKNNLDYYSIEVYGASPAKLFTLTNLLKKKLSHE